MAALAAKQQVANDEDEELKDLRNMIGSSSEREQV